MSIEAVRKLRMRKLIFIANSFLRSLLSFGPTFIASKSR